MRAVFRHLLLWFVALLLPAAAAFSQAGEALPGDIPPGLEESFVEVKPQNKVALIVGVEKYDWLGELKYTAKDARDFRKAFRLYDLLKGGGVDTLLLWP